MLLIIRIEQKRPVQSNRPLLFFELAYLSDEAEKSGKSEFDISFGRQKMADYLCVDRSTLSNEFSKLKVEGIFEFHRNHFKLNVALREESEKFA